MRKKIVAFALTLCSIFTSISAFATDSTAFDPTLISVTAQSSSGIPVGTVVAWPAALTNQTMCVAAASEEDAQANGCEWLICDGSTISSTAYPALYAIIGSTTLPNLKGRFLE
ncbi:MAG: tail fiber protein, partial [Pseudomonadota bacterium]